VGALGKGVAQASATTNAKETVFDNDILTDTVPWMVKREAGQGVAVVLVYAVAE